MVLTISIVLHFAELITFLSSHINVNSTVECLTYLQLACAISANYIKIISQNA